MKYAQLDTCAKEHAREQWRAAGHGDEWWYSTYEDAATIGVLMGIRIGTTWRRTVGGKDIGYPDINFSGFHTQGSYCSFGGIIRVADLAGAVEKVKTHVGNLDADEDLLTICQRAELVFAGINAHWVANRLMTEPSDEWEAPECTPTMTIQIENRDGQMRVDASDLSTEAEDDISALISAFADWIYNQLESEDEYLNSDECVIAGIEANEPDFDEDGNFE